MLAYRLIQRVNPLYLQQPKKWFATPCNRGRIVLTQMSRDIAGATALARGDVQAALTEITMHLCRYLADGYSVRLGELGCFHISFSSTGVDMPAQFSCTRIKGMRVVFVPGKELKEALSKARFESKAG